MRKPKNIAYGNAPANAFDEMDVTDLQAWLKENFQSAWAHYCPGPGDGGGEIDWATEAFPKFSPAVKTRFTDALVALLDELAQHPKQWEPREEANGFKYDPANELFVQIILCADHLSDGDKTKLATKALNLLEHDDLLPDIRARALNVLYVTDHRMENDFLLKQYEKAPTQLSAMIVFNSLAKRDPDTAFDFLAKQPLSIIDTPGMHMDIARIQERHDTETLQRGMEKLRAAHRESPAQFKEFTRGVDFFKPSGPVPGK